MVQDAAYAGTPRYADPCGGLRDPAGSVCGVPASRAVKVCARAPRAHLGVVVGMI